MSWSDGDPTAEASGCGGVTGETGNRLLTMSLRHTRGLRRPKNPSTDRTNTMHTHRLRATNRLSSLCLGAFVHSLLDVIDQIVIAPGGRWLRGPATNVVFAWMRCGYWFTTYKLDIMRVAHNLKVVGSNPTPATKKAHLLQLDKWDSCFQPYQHNLFRYRIGTVLFPTCAQLCASYLSSDHCVLTAYVCVRFRSVSGCIGRCKIRPQ